MPSSLRILPRALFAAALLGLTPTLTHAQDLGIPYALAAPLPSQSAPQASIQMADCTDGTQIVQDEVSAAFGHGDTATSTGGAQELGQSITAPCDGTFTAVQYAIQNASGATPEIEVDAVLTIYEGGDTSGQLLSTTEFTFTTPEAGFFARYDFEIDGDVQVVEGATYTFFLDITSNVNVATHAIQGNPYTAGRIVVGTSGSADGASGLDGLDLRFAATFDAPMAVSVETVAEHGFAFSPVYPNPVTRTGQLDLTVGSAQHVRVEAYDLLGRSVGMLFDGAVRPNQPVSLTFDAAGLAPGGYVVRALGESFATTRRVTVAR